jgi:hypothetical protein
MHGQNEAADLQQQPKIYQVGRQELIMLPLATMHHQVVPYQKHTSLPNLQQQYRHLPPLQV